jgi:hypothetical protein
MAERYKAMAKWFVPFFEQVDAPKMPIRFICRSWL